jgi:hypothetical protein
MTLHRMVMHTRGCIYECARLIYTNCFQTEMRLLFETHRGVSSRLLGRPFEPVAESELHTEQEQDGTETNENGDAEEGEVRTMAVLCLIVVLQQKRSFHQGRLGTKTQEQRSKPDVPVGALIGGRGFGSGVGRAARYVNGSCGRCRDRGVI